MHFTKFPDQLLSTGDDKTISCLRYGIYILVFDRQTGRFLRSETLPAEPAWQAFPSRNGERGLIVRRPISWSSPVLLEVWDLKRRRLVAKFGPMVDTAFRTYSISPDGRYLVGTGNERLSNDVQTFSMKLWDVNAGKELGSTQIPRFDFSHTGGSWSTRILESDGKSVLFTCGTSNQLLLQCLDRDTLKVHWERRLSGAGGFASETPDGKLLLSESPAVRANRVADGGNASVRLPADFHMEARSGSWKMGRRCSISPARGNTGN